MDGEVALRAVVRPCCLLAALSRPGVDFAVGAAKEEGRSGRSKSEGAVSRLNLTYSSHFAGRVKSAEKFQKDAVAQIEGDCTISQ